MKLHRLGLPTTVLKMINRQLGNRTAYISYGQHKSDNFNVRVGLPQDSALSSFMSIVYHCDLVPQLGAHSAHLFTVDPSIPQECERWFRSFSWQPEEVNQHWLTSEKRVHYACSRFGSAAQSFICLFEYLGANHLFKASST